MKRVMYVCVVVGVIFFSDSYGSFTSSIRTIESRPITPEMVTDVKKLRDLQLCMDGLWIEMMDGDDVGYEAYLAFLDAADNNFPIVSKEVMRKLARYELAYQYSEDSEIMFDEFKLNLWDKYGFLGDNMKPRVKGIQ